MFEYCNNIFEKISVVIALISIFALQGLSMWFFGVFLGFGMGIGFICQLLIVGCIISFEEVHKRTIISKYQKELDYKNNFKED